MTSDPDTESMLNTWQWEQGLLLFLSLLPKAGIGNLLVTHPLPRVSGPPHTWEVNLRKGPAALLRACAFRVLPALSLSLSLSHTHTHTHTHTQQMPGKLLEGEVGQSQALISCVTRRSLPPLPLSGVSFPICKVISQGSGSSREIL